MQTHPNLRLISAFFDAYSRGDMEDIEKVMDSKIIWHIPGKHPLSGTKKGIGEVLAYFQELALASFSAEPIVMGVNGDYVIDCHRNRSNLEGSENLNNMSCLLWRIENNKIVEVFNFPEDQHAVDRFFMKLYGG